METKIKIDPGCMESYPCKHLVTIDGKTMTMSGIEIVQYHRDNKLPIPTHFAYCVDFFNKPNKQKK